MALAAQSFDGSVVLVTGGAKNIGRAISEGFLCSGARVVTCGRRPPESLPQGNGREAEFIPCDVRKADQVAQLFSQLQSRYGRLDVLVNNAGGAPNVPAAEATVAFHESIIQLNLVAPLHCAQAANRLMQDQGGSIINIASVSAQRPSPGAAAYAAAKAGLVNLTRTLAMEWGPRVRVNAVIAGLIATEAADSFYGGPTGLARIAEMLPLKRMGRGEDIANACVYLASPLASYVSGAALEVHGGGEVPLFIHLTR